MKEYTLVFYPEHLIKCYDYYCDFLVKRGTCIGTFAPCIEAKKARTLDQALKILSDWCLQGYSCEILIRERSEEDDSGTWDILCYTK